MEKLGIIRRFSSPWASPLHMVEKKTPGTWRPCGDHRRLNKVTTHDRHPVPRLQDFASQLKGKKIFLKVDLICGYNQIPVAAADVPKTAVITTFLFPTHGDTEATTPSCLHSRIHHGRASFSWPGQCSGRCPLPHGTWHPSCMHGCSASKP